MRSVCNPSLQDFTNRTCQPYPPRHARPLTRLVGAPFNTTLPIVLRSPNLCSPNEDFGTSKNIRARHFVSTFHTPYYSIWAKRDEKCLQNVVSEYFSTFQNLRLGSIKLRNSLFATRRSLRVALTQPQPHRLRATTPTPGHAM